MGHGSGVGAETVLQTRGEPDPRRLTGGKLELGNKILHLVGVLGFGGAHCDLVLGTHSHEGADPDVLLQHLYEPRLLVEHLAEQS